MAREQLGICAEPNLHGLVFLLNARDGYQATLRWQLAKIPALILTPVGTIFGSESLRCSRCWRQLLGYPVSSLPASGFSAFSFGAAG